MPNYTKLFSTIVTSTIWQEPDRTRIVWITMLALSDKNGEIHASIPGLARVAGVPVEDCEKALTAFLSPDGYSRTPEHEGRRIAKIDGGWELLNFQKYRLLASTADTLAKNANRQKKWRQRNGQITDSNAPVTQGNAEVTPEAVKAESDSKAKSEAESDSEKKDPPPAKPRGIVDGKDSDLLPTSEKAKRVAVMFHRRLTTAWSEKERDAFVAIGTIQEHELELMEAFYGASIPADKDFRRHDLKTCLNNWPGEVDKARKWKRENNTQPKPANPQFKLPGHR